MVEYESSLYALVCRHIFRETMKLLNRALHKPRFPKNMSLLYSVCILLLPGAWYIPK